MKHSKVYKHQRNSNNSMLPGDRNGSPDESLFFETLVFVDEAFLNKLSKHLGGGRYLKFDKIKFCDELIKSVHKYVLLSKEDFENAPLNKSKVIKKDLC